jgi:glycosyl transferase family 2
MIVLLLVTQNEAEMLRLHLAHHLAWGVDHVCVADNESTDATAEVARSFGSAVTHLRFADFGERQRVRTRMLRDLDARFGRAQWVGVSDTDEFWWTPRENASALLADVPAEVPCATFRQKLFLPTELDAPTGSVYARLTHRVARESSPLFRSYHEGKSFYRGATLHRVGHEHRNKDVPGPVWWHPEAAVHHYMIQDEDQFVLKVSRLTSWQPRSGLLSKQWFHRLRAAIGLPPARPFAVGFKREWWDIWEKGGEPAVRAYYRTKYRIPAAELPQLLASGELVHDPAFAEYRAARDGDVGPHPR